MLTVIVELVFPLLHINDPVAEVDNVDVPLQLFVTVTSGVEGMSFGAAVAFAGSLVHPSNVAVTE